MPNVWGNKRLLNIFRLSLKIKEQCLVIRLKSEMRRKSREHRKLIFPPVMQSMGEGIFPKLSFVCVCKIERWHDIIMLVTNAHYTGRHATTVIQSTLTSCLLARKIWKHAEREERENKERKMRNEEVGGGVWKKTGRKQTNKKKEPSQNSPENVIFLEPKEWLRGAGVL